MNNYESRSYNISLLKDQNIGLVIEESYMEKTDYYLYTIIQNNKIGFIDKQAQLVIAPMFDKVEGSFINESALVKVAINNKWGVINSNGSLIIPLLYDRIYIFENMIFVRDINKEVGYYNDKGVEIITLGKYKRIDSFFREGIARVCDYNHKYGIVNNVGDVILEVKYDMILGFLPKEQTTTAKLDNEIYEIDLNELRKCVYTKEYRMEGRLLYNLSEKEIEKRIKRKMKEEL